MDPILHFCKQEVERQLAPPEDIPLMLDAWVFTRGLEVTRGNSGRLYFTADDLAEISKRVRGLGHTPVYRTTPVVFANGGYSNNWTTIPRAMSMLLQYSGDLTGEEFAKAFLDIHPFEDGNGRVAVLMMNLINGKIDTPEPLPDFYQPAH